VSGASGAYTTLASVGIKLQNNGTLLFTESTFNAALAADSVSVSKLFVTDSTIGATGIMSSFGTTIDNLTNTGSLVKSRLDGLSNESRRIGTNITKKQLDLTAYSEALTRQFANLESQVGRYKALLDTKIGTWNSTGTL
jgi:flagellar hook-associated protein 2